MTLYQQRRFAKLGYSAASILSALPLLTMLLDVTSNTNLLVQLCQLYLQSEVFITELEVLAFFTYQVTFPFLNCIEKSTQSDLLIILPKLHKDLLAKRTDTLNKFVVKFRNINIEKPESDLAAKILDEMCIDAAAGIQLQCGREYGFSNDAARATVISELTDSFPEGLPTNNIVAERDIAKFD